MTVTFPDHRTLYGPVPASAPFHNSPASSVRSVSSAASVLNPCRDPQLDFLWDGLAHNWPLLMVEEAAAELKCSDQHIRNFIHEGKLIAFPINVEQGANRKRNIYRIHRATASQAFTFLTSHQRAETAMQIIRTVNDWLFQPCYPAPELHHLASLKGIGTRGSLTIQECACALRATGTHIRELYDTQQIAAVDIARRDVTPGNRAPTPMHLRIQRLSLATFVQVRLCRQNGIDKI